MRKREQFAKNKEILNRFVADYPFKGMNDLAELFMSFTEKKLEGKAAIYLMIGKKRPKWFESLVSVKVKNPNMVLSSSNGQPQMPEFVLNDARDTVTRFYLYYITNIEIEKEKCDLFTRYNVNFSHMDFDYEMNIVIYK